MAGFSSPLRLAPSFTPRRAPSPVMSPGGRRGRTYGSSEEGRLRDLSPDTTLRAFTQRPLPFDTTRDEYKIFSCIDALTAAERELGARVAKAAQRLKSWCSEIEQWGWSGSFEQPSQEYREKRRRSLEMRIKEHMGNADLSDALPPLEYWGSLLSVEVESHEARLDDIEEEMIHLDVEELKEHVLDMHPAGKSRPSSAGLDASRSLYKPMDDFSFLITQTLLSALPHHAQLKERLNSWTARISILRQVPRYLRDLETAQNAMRLGWDAIEQPTDTSDAASTQWKDAVGTITGVLASKVGDLGKRLDRMLDTLEGRKDCIPDSWIDNFEGIEADYGRWMHESRRRIVDFDVRRKWQQKKPEASHNDAPQRVDMAPVAVHPTKSTLYSSHETSTTTDPVLEPSAATNPSNVHSDSSASPTSHSNEPTSTANSASDIAAALLSNSPADLQKPAQTPSLTKTEQQAATLQPKQHNNGPVHTPSKLFLSQGSNSPASTHSPTTPLSASARRSRPWFLTEDSPHSTRELSLDPVKTEPTPCAGLTSTLEHNFDITPTPKPTNEQILRKQAPGLESSILEEDSEYEEGDTMVHNEIDDSLVEVTAPDSFDMGVTSSTDEKEDAELGDVVNAPNQPGSLANPPVIITNDGLGADLQEPPRTPRSRRGSIDSLSSDMSFDESPRSPIEDSPSVRNATSRATRASRPELNAAMAKRRTGKVIKDNAIANPPWPPTQFSQKNSAEDLEQKISDILTTIPAHIRLTSGPNADSPEVRRNRGIVNKSSRTHLRAVRSSSGLKSPELTLSPAKSEFDIGTIASGRKSAASARGDNDIKLYHLTQPGKEQPVKLFIRRVGENGERVMVRVGGGWADLGEYLRSYAEHHGRRTASDGKFEILGLEVKNSDNVSSPTRPESVMSKRDRRFSGGTSTSPNNTPIKYAALNDSKEEGSPLTPGGAGETFVPSTNSSQRSWKGNEVGLAGPNTKRLDLSGDKLDWVEGMMKQARTVSGSVAPTNYTPTHRDDAGRADSRNTGRAESRNAGRVESRNDTRSASQAGPTKAEFGDLGKVGGTKRIFMRGGRPYIDEH